MSIQFHNRKRWDWLVLFLHLNQVESHDDITEKRLYQNIFASHFGQLAIIFLWTSGNLFRVPWNRSLIFYLTREKTPEHTLI